MKRRDFLACAALAPTALAIRPARAAEGWRSFDVVTRVDVAEPAGATRLWLPVPLREAGDYQRVLAMHWHAPGAAVSPTAAFRRLGCLARFRVREAHGYSRHHPGRGAVRRAGAACSGERSPDR